MNGSAGFATLGRAAMVACAYCCRADIELKMLVCKCLIAVFITLFNWSLRFALLSRLTVDMGSYDAAVTFMVRQHMAC
jgi:hypothetical protein